MTGPHAGDWTVTSPPTSPVPPGGSSQFTARFSPAAPGLRSATLSIASDDADESPFQFAVQGAGRATGRESIFPDTKIGRDIDFDGTYYELGTVFQSSVPGTITHLRVYSLASESGDHTARIWRNNDETVIGGPYTWNYGGVTGWITLDIPDVDIEAGIDYTVSISTGTSAKRNYPNIAADLSTAGGNGQHLTYPVNAGKFGEVRDARPTGSFNGGNYLRDIVFVRAGAVTPQLRIVRIVADLTTGSVTLQWEGDGPLFQVEKAVTLTGTFQPVGPAQTEKVFTDPGALKTNAQSFYRVR